jgi:glutamate-1-semialdehyde aminotransferase
MALYQQSVESLPGGNTRTILHTSPFPLYMKSGSGYQLTSEDSHTYVIWGRIYTPMACCKLTNDTGTRT